MLLYPLTHVYKILWSLEGAFFRNFEFLRYKPAAKVVSVGNLTFGGTGKTPVLIELLRLFSPSRKIAVLTRGYRSPWERGFYLLHGSGPHPPTLTDEALLINRLFPEVPIFLGKNRRHAAQMAEKCFSPDLFLLDDGFQYRRLKKDIELVLWDSTVSPETSRLIPAGTLREPLSRLGDATAILLTRCESVSPEILKERISCIESHARKIPIIQLVTQPVEWLNPEGNRISLNEGPSRVFPFAGIAQPANFLKQLSGLGADPIGSKWFRDHHFFHLDEFSTLSKLAEKASATLVCTEKDRIKIPVDLLRKFNIFCLRIAMKPADGSTFDEALRRTGVKL